MQQKYTTSQCPRLIFYSCKLIFLRRLVQKHQNNMGSSQLPAKRWSFLQAPLFVLPRFSDIATRAWDLKHKCRQLQILHNSQILPVILYSLILITCANRLLCIRSYAFAQSESYGTVKVTNIMSFHPYLISTHINSLYNGTLSKTVKLIRWLKKKT